MKNELIVVMLCALFVCCCTSQKKAVESKVNGLEELTADADSIVETDTIVEPDTIVETTVTAQVMDTITKSETKEEELKAPATFIDSISTQYSSLLGDCEQLLVVFNSQASSIVSELEVYELKDDGWVAVDSLAGTCNIGKKGFAPYGKKAEGDGKSPTGIFSITHFFSKNPKFTARLEKIKVTQNTIWVDDVKDPLYNKYCEQSETHPRKGEKLIRQDGQYDYVMVINYNTEERIPNKGSAIFFHVWRRPGSGTAGCVAVNKQHILNIFDWIDAAKHPMILMGSREDNGLFQIEGTKYQ